MHNDPQQPGIKITIVSIVLNIILAILKCTLGWISHSRALLGDGLHSLLDLATDTVALFGLKIAHKPQDENHHYGHHKFSSYATLLIALIIIGFSVALIISSVNALSVDEEFTPHWPALAIAFISLVTKELLYWRTRAIAIKLKSSLLMANAWHHRTDSLSSVLVFLALLATTLGGPQWYFLDSALGLFLGFYLGLQGLKIFFSSSQDLLDTAPENHIINDLREHILPTPGTVAYHNFRVRKVGDFFEVDLHLQVDPALTVQDGHLIASDVKKNILEKHKEVLDVLIHIEPATPHHLKDAGIHQKP